MSICGALFDWLADEPPPGESGAALGAVRVDAAICDGAAAVTSVSSASEMPSAVPLRSSSILRAAASNHGGMSTSPPPWRPAGRPVRTSSCAAVGARCAGDSVGEAELELVATAVGVLVDDT